MILNQSLALTFVVKKNQQDPGCADVALVTQSSDHEPLTADKRLCASMSFQRARLSQSQRSIAAQSNHIISAGANQSSPEI